MRPDGTGLEWLAGGGFDNPVEVAFTTSGETIGTMTYFKDPENGERDALLHFVEGGVYPKTYPQVMGEFKRTGDLMPVMTKFARIAPVGACTLPQRQLRKRVSSNLFTAQFNPHRVQRHVVHREGATFRTETRTSSRRQIPTSTHRRARRRRWKPARARHRRMVHSRLSDLARSQTRDQRRNLPHPEIDAPSAGSSRRQTDLAAFTNGRVAKLLEDARPALRDRAIEFLVQQAAAVPALTSLRDSSKNDEARAAAVFALYRIRHTRSSRRSPCRPQRLRLQRSHRRCAMRRHEPRCGSRPATHRDREGRSSRCTPASDRSTRPDRRCARDACLNRCSRQPRGPLRRTLDDLFPDHAEPTCNLAERTNQREPKVRKAALIAMDQLDSSPLRREQIAPSAKNTLTRNSVPPRSGSRPVTPTGLESSSHIWGERLRDPVHAPEELESVRDALVAFSENKAASGFVAKTSRRPRPRRETSHLHARHDRRYQAEGTACAWTSALSKLIDSPRANVRTRTVELIRSRAIPGLQ